MKVLYYLICLIAFVGFLSTTAAIAQLQPNVPLQKSNPTNTTISIQQGKVIDDRIYRFTREEVARV